MEYFRIYNNAMEMFQELSAEQIGHIVLAACAYSRGEELPELSAIERIVFIRLRQTIDQDTKAYNARCERNAENSKQPRKKQKKQKATKDEKNSQSLIVEKQSENASLQSVDNNEDTERQRVANLDKKNDKKSNKIATRSQYENENEYENEYENENKNENKISLSLSPLSSEKRGDEVAREKQRIFEIFYFEKNFIEPKNEVERFFDYYTANGWQRNGSTIRDKTALAKLWKPQKEGNREDPELLGWLYATYTNAKTTNPADAETILHGIHRTTMEMQTDTTSGAQMRCGVVWCDRPTYTAIETYMAKPTPMRITYKVLRATA